MPDLTITPSPVLPSRLDEIEAVIVAELERQGVRANVDSKGLAFAIFYDLTHRPAS